MSTAIQIAVIAYAMVGSFVAGQNVNRDTWGENALAILISVLFGPLIVVAYVIVEVWRAINGQMQINALFQFYVLRKFRNKDEEYLRSMNVIARMHTGLRGVMWRYLAKRISKVNGYDFARVSEERAETPQQ